MQNPIPRHIRILAMATAVATLFLVCIGGMVTSKGVGMSVPDWPNSYGYNMFLLPWDKWSQGGIFWEHSHRLKGAFVGLLTMSLAISLWFSRVPDVLRKLGLVAFFGVVLQGILGGFRVVFDKHGWGAEFGVIHAAVAQLFFSLICVIALMTTRRWQSWSDVGALQSVDSNLRRWAPVVTVLIFVQLLIGASMRHQHAGLAIPDFPLAYGNVWPDTSAAAVAGYNQARVSMISYNDITAGQIILQMVHRIMAYTIAGLVIVCWWRTRKTHSAGSPLRHFANTWLALILVQVALGATTIWTKKAADVATAHMAVGALSLMTGALFSMAAFRLLPSSQSQRLPRSAADVAARTA